MHNLYDNLYELCEIVENDLSKMLDNLRKKGGELSGADVEYIDKLTHTLKSIKTTMAMMDAEDEYSQRGGSYYNNGQGGGSRGGGGGNSSYYREGGQGGSSYARGRGRNARRDRMGRYSREGGGYSRNTDEMVEQLEMLMEEAPNEQVKQRMRQLMQELEQM